MAAYCILATALSATWFANLPFQVVRFDFALIAVACLSFYSDWKHAVPVLIFFGVVGDMTSDAPFGVSAFSYLVIYAGIRLLISKISFQGGPALLFWAAVISATDKAVTAVLYMMKFGDVSAAEVLLKHAPAQIAMDAVMALALIPAVKWWSELTWEKITKPKGLVLK